MLTRLAVAAALALLVAAPSALAATRHAAPAGTSADPCSAVDPCDLDTAVEGASPGDEVLVAAGDYGSAVAPLPDPIGPGTSGIAIRGPDTGPRPRIFSSASVAWFPSGADRISELEIVHSGALIAMAPSSDTILEGMLIQSSGVACGLANSQILRNSVCWSQGAGDAAVSFSFSFADAQAPLAATVRNVTAVSDDGPAIRVSAADHTRLVLGVTNTIAQGSADDVAASVGGTEGERSAAVELDHSNYQAVTATGGATVTPAGSATNQTGAPLFADVAAGDFHQAPGSPTIDAGTDNPANGVADIDRFARVQGARTDVGADEEGTAPAPPPDTTPPDTALTSGPAQFATTSDTTPTFGFSSSEAGSTFECGYDGEPLGPCSGPGATHTPGAPLGEGLHVFSVRARDASGNLDPSQADRSFTVDVSSPPAPPGPSPPVSGPPPATAGIAPPVPGPADTVAPAVSRVSMLRRTFAIGRGATPRSAARRARRGSGFRYRLSERATVTIRIERLVAGRRSGRRCVTPRRAPRGRRCSRGRRQGTIIRRGVGAGRALTRFSGRIGRRALRPGRYRATITAVDAAGNRSRARRVHFSVVRR